MIVIAGGTGRLGTAVVRLITARRLPVRVLTRDVTRARHIAGPLVEVVRGDVREPGAVDEVLAGATTLISAIHGFAGTGGDSPQTIDDEGNRQLIEAAERAGVKHMILLSVYGASPDHPMELMRMKHRAENALRASTLSWTIIQPTAYMETWATLVGAPLIETGRTRIFGRGMNPINFVSVHDVARIVDLALLDPTLQGEIISIGGPDNLTMREVVTVFQETSGAVGKVRHIPLPMMRVMAVMMRPINATLARQIQAGVIMDTRDMTFDSRQWQRRFPSIPLTSLADVVQRDYGARISAAAGQQPIAEPRV